MERHLINLSFLNRDRSKRVYANSITVDAKMITISEIKKWGGRKMVSCHLRLVKWFQGTNVPIRRTLRWRLVHRQQIQVANLGIQSLLEGFLQR